MYGKEEVGLFLLARGDGMSVREASGFAGVPYRTGRRWSAGALPHSYTGAPRGATIGAADGTGRRGGAVPKGTYDPPASGPLAGLTPDQIENILLRAVLADLKAGGWAPGSISNRSKCELGERLRRATGLPLRSVIGFLRISKSSYEYHRARLGRRGAREELAPDVERIFRAEGRSARGYRYVTARLAAELGRPVSEKVVRDVMRERGLRPVYLRRRRRYSSYAGELDAAPPNLPLDGETGRHDFSAAAPNEKWVSDITEFRLPGDARKVYLSPVVDLFDGRPVAWSVGTRPDAGLADSSLRGACASLAPGGPRPFVHTDRGCHYRWPGWKRVCEEHGLARSMSRKGRSPDNAAMEGFFGRLKNEFFHGRDWAGVTAEEFMGRLDAWLRYYREGRLRRFVGPGGEVTWETIDGRRRRLGLPV